MKFIKVLSITMIAAFLFGCSSGTGGGKAVIPSTTNINYPAHINITSLGAFTDSDNKVDEVALHDWESYMSDLYKTQITLSSYNTKNLDVIKKEIESGTIRGMVDTYPIAILSLIKSEKIMPIEEYLSDNKVWNSLPEDYRKQFEIDGHIWAISKSTTDYVRATSIRTDWMKAVGKQMPQSHDELFALGEAFVKGDPDKDGVAKNNYLMGFGNASWVDLLATFGVYINITHVCPISYDPTMDCIVDAMFKPEAKTALQYIKDMYKAGMIDYKSFSAQSEANTNNSEGIYGSVLGFPYVGKYDAGVKWAENNSQALLGRTLDMTNADDVAYATSVYEIMPPFKTEYPIAYASARNGYVLTKNTKDPKAVVNAFVDMLFASPRNYLDCYYGKPESYTDKGSNVYVANIKDKSTGQIYTKPQIINAPNLIFGDNYAFINTGVYSEQAAQLYKDKTSYTSNYIKYYSDRLLNRSALYELSGDTVEIQLGAISNSFVRLMTTLANENITVDQALEEYRANVKLYQIDQILKESNENIGKTSKQVIQ